MESRSDVLQQELQRLQHLGALLASYEGRLKHVHDALHAVFTAPEPGEFNAQARGALQSVRRLTCTSRSFAELEADTVPPELFDGLVEGQASRVLHLLDTVEAGLQELQPLRAGLRTAMLAEAQWDLLVACHANRHHNQRHGDRLLMQLPQEVLCSIIHRAGPGARLVCTHLFHNYGPPGTDIDLDALQLHANNLHWYPHPEAVTSLTCRDRRLSPSELKTIARTFTNLQRLEVTQASHCLDSLPTSITSLKLTVTAAYPPEPYPLFTICHLTALQELQLDRLPTEAPGWGPLSTLTSLTALSLTDARLQPVVGPRWPQHSQDCWKRLWALTRLRRLHLFVNIEWWHTRMPQIALPWPGLQQLSLRCLPCMVAGPLHMCKLARLVRWVLPERADLTLERYDYLQDGDFELSQVLHGMRSRSLILDCSTAPGRHLLPQTAPALHNLGAFSLRVRQEAIQLATLQCLIPDPVPLHTLTVADGYHRNPWPGESFLAPRDLLGTLAPNLQHVTRLHLHLPNYVHPQGADAPPHPMTSALCLLRCLELSGSNVVADLAPSLPQLPALTSLALQCNQWDEGLVPLGRVADQLGGLLRLSLQGGLPPAADSEGPGSLDVVSRLAQLRDLEVQCEEPVSAAQVGRLLPVRPSLRRVAVRWRKWNRVRRAPWAVNQEWMADVRRLLAPHVPEVVVEGRAMAEDRWQ